PISIRVPILIPRGIVSGYREPRSSAAACLLSAFQMSNETLNIWTHFVPAWYFAWQLAAALRPRRAWPFLAYLLSCCLYPLASSGAHTFGAMSRRARHLGYFLDYAALGTYSLGSALAYSAYAFPPEWLGGTFHLCYVPVAVLNAALATGLACYSRIVEPARPRLGKAARTAAFACPYLFDSIPIFYRVRWACSLGACAARGCAGPALPLHGRHTALALLAGLVFASHLPERLAPGRFDRLGHSHQLFHVCAILGTHFQVEAVRMDMAALPAGAAPAALSTLIPMGIGAGASLAVVALCSASLGRVQQPSSAWKLH
uniref:Progestin and adipoQ receptor family member 5 n=1 Tax=Nothoprocta perdicaria TaxID=30464 RepID=A0A8C6ZAA1_NOTPE